MEEEGESFDQIDAEPTADDKNSGMTVLCVQESKVANMFSGFVDIYGG